MSTLEVLKMQVDQETQMKDMSSGEINLLPVILRKGEKLKATVAGHYKDEPCLGTLIATNQRLIHLTYFSIGNSKTECVYLDEIKSITEHKAKGMSGEHSDLIIKDITGYEYAITRIPNNSLIPIRKHVKSNLADSTTYKEITN